MGGLLGGGEERVSEWRGEECERERVAQSQK